MKNGIIKILAFLFSAGILVGCKKENGPAAKDYAASIKEKTWWGVVTYTGKEAEYYSVHFNSDNTLMWSQFAGDYSGHWATSGNALTITLDVGDAEIKAAIGDDETLLNITDNTENFEINTGQRIANPNVTLDNTEWKGNFTTGLPYILEIGFRPPSKIDIYFFSDYLNYSYSRSASGAVIRTEIKPVGSAASSRFFGVIISETTMLGSEKNADNIWKATKQ